MTSLSVFGVQDGWVFANPCVNNPTWYISVLVLCYVIFFALTYTAKRLQISPYYFYLGMILLGCGINTYGINLPFLNLSSCRGYYAFFSGIILARCLDTHKPSKKIYIFCAFTICFLTYCIVCRPEWIGNNINYLLVFCYYPALVVLFMSPIMCKCTSKKFFGVMGEITYDVYLWHNPNFLLMYILLNKLKLNVNLLTVKAMIVYTIINFAIGAVSHYVLELPLTHYLEKRIAIRTVES